MAVERLSRESGVRDPVALMFSTYLRLNAFGGAVTSEQEDLLWQLATDAYDALLRRGTLGGAAALPVGMLWKGLGGEPVWTMAQNGLPAELRAPLAYILAHRLVQRKAPREAIEPFFTAAVQSAPTDSPLARLAQDDLQLLKDNQGRLHIISSVPEKLTLTVRQSGRVVTQTEITNATTLDLAPGTYDLGVSVPNQPAAPARDVLSASSYILQPKHITITTPRRHIVHLDSFWKPSNPAAAIPGFVPRPAKLPGIGRWQLLADIPPNSGALSPNGDLMAFVSVDEHLHVHDARTWQFQCAFVRPGGLGVNIGIAWSPDGRRVACVADRTIQTWDVAERRAGPVMQHKSGINHIAWSPDGRRLAAAATWSHEFLIWSADGILERIIDVGSGVGVESLAWSPDGRSLVSASNSRRGLEVWSVSDGLVQMKIEQPSKAVSFSPDGRRIAASVAVRKPEDDIIRVYNANDGTLTLRLGKDHGSEASCVEWSPDGRWIAASTWAWGVFVWDAENGREALAGRHIPGAHRVCWHPDSDQLVSIGGNGRVHWWTVGESEARAVLGPGEIYHLYAVPSPDASRLAVPRPWTNDVAILDDRGHVVHWLRGHVSGCAAPAWSADGQRLATPSYDKTVRLWNVDGTAGPVLRGHDQVVRGVAWDPRGRRLASASDDKTVRLWNDDGTPGPVLVGHEAPASSVAWSPDGAWVASAGWDKTVRLWSHDGRAGPVLRGHDHSVGYLDWNPNGQWLASCSTDRTLRLWSSSGTPGPVLKGHGSTVLAASWSSDGRRLASVAADRTIRIWSIDGTLLTTLGTFGENHRIAWTDHDNRLLCSGTRGIQWWNVERGEMERFTLLGPDGETASFDASGRLLYGDLAEMGNWLYYGVETKPGVLEKLTPVEFHRRIGLFPPRNAAGQPAPEFAKAPFTAEKAQEHQQAWAAHLGVPVVQTNSLAMPLALIPPGEFEMGAPDADASAQADARPQHHVALVRPFLMGVHELTIGQFRQFVEATGYKTEPERDGQGGVPLDGDGGPKIASVTWSSPGIPKLGAPPLGDDHPVTQITWNDAVAFCEWLSKQEGVTYRLPSEAEWEYACRAGTTTTYYTGDELKPDQANVPGDTPRQTTSVGRFPPNAFGLCDMLGNVYESCSDWYAPWYYAGSPPENPLGPSTGRDRIARGGSFWDGGRSANAYHRQPFHPTFRFFHTGFRVVRELEVEPSPISGKPRGSALPSWPGPEETEH